MISFRVPYSQQSLSVLVILLVVVLRPFTIQNIPKPFAIQMSGLPIGREIGILIFDCVTCARLRDNVSAPLCGLIPRQQ
uniref:Putative secreted protein n=1 Tax=Anopheles darlingi TaxID=43151 RepID=A0A2M4DH79_ANODA